MIYLSFVISNLAFAAVPQRIVSGMPSITEILFALGLGERVVGVTTNCNYPPEAKKKEKIGGFFLNLEKIVSLKPDLVIMLEDAQKRDVKKFKKYGLPVYTINPLTVKDVMDSIVEIGKKTGANKKARILIVEMIERIAEAKPKRMSLKDILNRPKALAVVGYKPLIVAGGDTFIDDILKQAGAKNIAGKCRAAYPQYSFERLLKENPEYIIIPEGLVKKSEIMKSKRWRSLDAVKKDRVLFINADILSRPGPRVVEAIERISRFINEKKT